MANIEVSQVQGKDNWALMLDPDGFIAEGTGNNFFIVKGNVVITPEGRNILRGISREYVMTELKKIKKDMKVSNKTYKKIMKQHDQIFKLLENNSNTSNYSYGD